MGTFDGLLNARRAVPLGELIHDDSTTPLTLWRVQNSDGVGVYASRAASNLESATYAYGKSRYTKFGYDDWLFFDTPLKLAENARPINPELEELMLERKDHKMFDDESAHPTEDFKPIEWRDLSTEERRKFKFAFQSKESAVDWFGPKTLAYFEKQGFVLAPVKAKKAYLSESGRQVVYLPFEES